MNILTAQVLLFRHNILVVVRSATLSTAAQFTLAVTQSRGSVTVWHIQSHSHSHSSQSVTVTVECRRSRLGCFESARRTGYIVGRTACWICSPTLYFQFYRSLRFESDARKRSLPHQTPLLTPVCACAQPTAFHACVKYFNLVVSVFSECFPYNLFYFCVNHCVCASYCEVNQINKHKHRFVVVNNTLEIVAIRSVCERKTPSEQADVKSTRHMDGDVCFHQYGKFKSSNIVFWQTATLI